MLWIRFEYKDIDLRGKWNKYCHCVFIQIIKLCTYQLQSIHYGSIVQGNLWCIGELSFAFVLNILQKTFLVFYIF